MKTLDDQMVHKLCVRSMQRGNGSMDYIPGSLSQKMMMMTVTMKLMV